MNINSVLPLFLGFTHYYSVFCHVSNTFLPSGIDFYSPEHYSTLLQTSFMTHGALDIHQGQHTMHHCFSPIVFHFLPFFTITHTHTHTENPVCKQAPPHAASFPCPSDSINGALGVDDRHKIDEP